LKNEYLHNFTPEYHIQKRYPLKNGMGSVDLLAFEGGFCYWSEHLKVPINREEKMRKLNVFELETLGYKIKNSVRTETEINEMMTLFDKNVPYPNGSSLFFIPKITTFNETIFHNMTPQ
jgi:hypothetical protein